MKVNFYESELAYSIELIPESVEETALLLRFQTQGTKTISSRGFNFEFKDPYQWTIFERTRGHKRVSL